MQYKKRKISNSENILDLNLWQNHTKQYETESIQENLLNYIQLFFFSQKYENANRIESSLCKRISEMQIYVLVPYYCHRVSLYT